MVIGRPHTIDVSIFDERVQEGAYTVEDAEQMTPEEVHSFKNDGFHVYIFHEEMKLW